MQNERVVCVDFGSSYTKIALRSGWDKPAKLLSDLPVAPNEFCVPSVVARVEKSGRASWRVGHAAAALTPGEGIHVYQNWKAKLLSEGAAAKDVAENTEVGIQYFKALGEALGANGVSLSSGRNPVRICVPKIGDGKETVRRMTEVLTKAGWHLSPHRPTVFEPESNAIGVMTRGRNATWTGSSQPHYRGMFGEEALVAAIRRSVLNNPDNQKVYYGVLIVDVGAFTTDFGFIRFDTEDDTRPEIVQHSREVGVAELDGLVWQQLSPAVRQALTQLSARDWEQAKALLYQGKAAAIRNPKGGKYVIGEGAEAGEIASVITEFGGRIITEIKGFAKGLSGTVNAYMLTGGGAAINPLRGTLLKALNRPNSRLYDLLNPDEPLDVLLKKKDPISGRWYHEEREVEKRRQQNYELNRAGSAIGGCSVFFSQ